MSSQLPHPNEPEISPALAVVSLLHSDLVASLSEMVGDSVRVRESRSAEHGLVSYGFAADGCDVVVHLQPYSGEAALFRADVLIGRVIPEYRRALRWLACNRSANTVGLAVSEEIIARRELRLSYARITAPGDPISISSQLADIIDESTRTADVLNAWFPQRISGAWLVRLAEDLEDPDEDAFFQGAISNPRDMLRVLDADWGAHLRTQLARFAGDWESLGKHALDLEQDGVATGDTDRVTSALSLQLTASYRLGRYEQALALAKRIVEDLGYTDEPERNATARAACLVRLGRYREALDAIEATPVQDDPRVIFWKACANAGLRKREEASAAFDRYVGMCGPDILGEKLIRGIVAKEETIPEPLSFDADTEERS